eukprot:7382032-Prymnesium_polylepis.2
MHVGTYLPAAAGRNRSRVKPLVRLACKQGSTASCVLVGFKPVPHASTFAKWPALARARVTDGWRVRGSTDCASYTCVSPSESAAGAATETRV